MTQSSAPSPPEQGERSAYAHAPASGDSPVEPKPPDPTEADICAAFELFGSIDTAIEIRAPKATLKPGAKPSNVVHRFASDDCKAAAKLAFSLSGRCPAVYHVMNGVAWDLPIGSVRVGAKAEDIVLRRWLLIDCDPRRKGTVSSTDAEKAAAWEVCQEIRMALRARGWPDPIVADSGNGFHLVYHIDLPADEDSLALVKSVLEALAARHDTEAVGVDTTVHDAPRLVKVYGTLTMKGEPNADRPHRYARLLEVPAELAPVPVVKLAGLVAEGKPVPRSATPPMFPAVGTNGHAVARNGDGSYPLEARVKEYLDKVEPAVEGQKGSNKTFGAVCRVALGFDLDQETAYAWIQRYYNPRCEPPWPDNQLRHKIEDAYKKPGDRGWLLNAPRNGHPAKRSTNGKPPGPPAATTVTPPEPPPRPDIEVTNERHIAADEAVRALRSAPDLYVRGDALVKVVAETENTQRVSTRTVIKGLKGSPKLVALSDANVGCLLTSVATFYRWTKDKNDESTAVVCAPADWLIKAVSTRKHWPGVRKLVAVSECPFPRYDGSIVETPGFDVETSTLYAPAIHFPPVPEKPTRDDARAAWGRLKVYVREFPYASEEDRVVFLAGLLTIIGRPAIVGPVPGIAVVGNKAGTGKGLHVDAMVLPGTGRCCPTMSYPESKEEAVKVKVAIAKGAKAAVHFDNLDEGALYGNGPLDSALTSPEIDDRQLGGNDAPSLTLRSAWFLSGNNVAPGKDAHRRWLVCNLRTELDHPEERTDIEQVDLRGAILANRGEIVRDALTILRAHSNAGRIGGGWGPMGSFEDWDLVVRGAVWFATGIDCLTTQKVAAAESPDRAEKLALLAGLAELPEAKFGKRGVTSLEAIQEVERSPGLYETLRNSLIAKGYGGKLVTSTKLGYILRSLANTPIGPFTLRKHPDLKNNVAAWMVEELATRDERDKRDSCNPRTRNSESHAEANGSATKGAPCLERLGVSPASLSSLAQPEEDWTRYP